MSIIKLFLPFILFFIIGNYGIHLYFKQKRALFFKNIGNRKFREYLNLKTVINATSKISFSLQSFRADVVLFENSLYVLLKNSNLKGLINQNQSILQISRNENIGKFEGISKVYFLEKYEINNNKIKIFSTQNLIVSAKFEIIIDFKDRLEELKIVENYLSEIKQ
jgi:hypothetical protein